MRRDRSPSEDGGRAPNPVWDNPGSQLPGTGLGAGFESGFFHLRVPSAAPHHIGNIRRIQLVIPAHLILPFLISYTSPALGISLVIPAHLIPHTRHLFAPARPLRPRFSLVIPAHQLPDLGLLPPLVTIHLAPVLLVIPAHTTVVLARLHHGFFLHLLAPGS